MEIISVWETTMCTGTTRWGGKTIRVCIYWTLVGDCNIEKKKTFQCHTFSFHQVIKNINQLEAPFSYLFKVGEERPSLNV